MKKFLHVIMFVLLSVTALQITSVQAADSRPKVDYGPVEFGKELSVSADQNGLDGSIIVTVPKDGYYSVRVKPESTQYQTVSGGIYKNDEEVEPYAEDFRTSDNTKLRYYELKKRRGSYCQIRSKIDCKSKSDRGYSGRSKAWAEDEL